MLIEPIWAWRLRFMRDTGDHDALGGGVQYTKEAALSAAISRKNNYIYIYREEYKGYAYQHVQYELKEIHTPNDEIWKHRLWSLPDEARFDQFRNSYWACSAEGMLQLNRFLDATRAQRNRELEIIDSLKEIK